MLKFENKKTEKLFTKLKKYYMTRQMMESYTDFKEVLTYKKLALDIKYCYDWILDGSSSWSYEDSDDVNLKAFLKRFLVKKENQEFLKDYNSLF